MHVDRLNHLTQTKRLSTEVSRRLEEARRRVFGDAPLAAEVFAEGGLGVVMFIVPAERFSRGGAVEMGDVESVILDGLDALFGVRALPAAQVARPVRSQDVPSLDREDDHEDERPDRDNSTWMGFPTVAPDADEDSRTDLETSTPEGLDPTGTLDAEALQHLAERPEPGSPVVGPDEAGDEGEGEGEDDGEGGEDSAGDVE